ncbi:MAG: MBL fold metallo-hydrolase [Planctomycetia bacterium]|nr:MBL fold metallo-hydrolase [Planctomycetia bacterium]
MRFFSLQSGSNGNCFYLECGETRLLFDAGISGVRAQTILAQNKIDIRSVDALLISHDHYDHVSCAGVFHRKFGLPVWMTPKTYQTVKKTKKTGTFSEIHHFTAGERFFIKNIMIETLSTPHNATDGVCFAVDDGKHRFGICTDLGHSFPGLSDFITSLDGILLESDFDPEMLENSYYPPSLIATIRGKHGHLSNFDAAELLAKSGKRIKHALLGHISSTNNTEKLVQDTHRKILGSRFPLQIASRYRPSDLTEII